MISIVMAYWKRPDLLRESLFAYEEMYGGRMNFEVVVINDGDKDFPSLPLTRYSFPLICQDLPLKEDARNPCVPLNEAVKLARGHFLLITNPEIIHKTPILEELFKDLQNEEYRAAAVWDVERKMFLCDTVESPLRRKVMGRAQMPKGAGLHFCAALTKKTFIDVGGFDERYRNGQAFDDNDFLWRMHKAGVKFSIHDNLLVEHHQTRTKWPSGGHASNDELFHNTWDSYIREHGDD